MSKQIVMSFDQAGGVKIDAEGFVGQSCEETTSVFERVLTGSGRRENKKPEYYESESASPERVNQRF